MYVDVLKTRNNSKIKIVKINICVTFFFFFEYFVISLLFSCQLQFVAINFFDCLLSTSFFFVIKKS